MRRKRPDFDEARKEADAIVNAIKPILTGRQSIVISLALAELVALLIAGHGADVREEILKLHIATVRELYPIAARHFGIDPPTEETP